MEIIYKKYEVKENKNTYVLNFYYEIKELDTFKHSIVIDKKYIKKLDNVSLELIFNIGMIEMINYYKITCPRNIIVEAGYLNSKSIEFFKKLFYLGLGELRYVNNIDTSFEEFTNITCLCTNNNTKKSKYVGNGLLIPIGGGKDSLVTLEVLRNKKEIIDLFMINPKKEVIKCVKKGGYFKDKIIGVKRILDKKISYYNNKGYINGHVPFSSIISFISLFIAYENDKKYIITSCEGSANEESVIGSDINHQYSKSFEYEIDFNDYVKNILKIDITYFSILRPLNELTIAMMFSKYKKYHMLFRSCNLGSKGKSWIFCNNCPKCLFTYITLLTFLDKENVIKIFGCDLLDRKDLLDTFKMLIGEGEHKPFECVGTIKEVKTAMSIIVKKEKKLSFLEKYYNDNYKLEEYDFLSCYDENNLNEEFSLLLKGEIKRCLNS